MPEVGSFWKSQEYEALVTLPERVLNQIYEWLDLHEVEGYVLVDWNNEIGFAPEVLYEKGKEI